MSGSLDPLAAIFWLPKRCADSSTVRKSYMSYTTSDRINKRQISFLSLSLSVTLIFDVIIDVDDERRHCRLAKVQEQADKDCFLSPCFYDALSINPLLHYGVRYLLF